MMLMMLVVLLVMVAVMGGRGDVVCMVMSMLVCTLVCVCCAGGPWPHQDLNVYADALGQKEAQLFR